MPKRHSKAPTRFQSDDEDEGHVEQSSSTVPAPSKSDADDIPPAPKQQPGRLARVYTLPDDDNSSTTDVNPPIYASQASLPSTEGKVEETRVANFTDLIAILVNSNASMKGRVDDTGRYELKFELNREHKHANRRRPGYDDDQSSVESNRQTGSRGKPGSRMIGWTKK